MQVKKLQVPNDICITCMACAACSFSFLLASEVLVAQESLVNSIQIVHDKLLEGNGKNIRVGFAKGILPSLRNELGNSARKLLMHDWDCENHEDGGKSKVR